MFISSLQMGAIIRCYIILIFTLHTKKVGYTA